MRQEAPLISGEITFRECALLCDLAAQMQTCLKVGQEASLAEFNGT